MKDRLKRFIYISSTILISMFFLTSCLYLFDHSAPEVEISMNPVPTNSGQTVTITVTAKDNDKIEKIELYNNNILLTRVFSDELSYSWLVPYGEIKLRAKAYDRNGNVGIAEFPQYQALKVSDSKAPSISIDILPFSDLVAGDPVTVKIYAKDNESGIDRVYLYIDGQRYTPILEDGYYSYNWIAQAGEHLFYAVAYDFGNNRSISNKLTLSVGGDSKKPELSVSHPDSVLPGTYFSIKIIASDESGIKKIDFSDSYGKNEVESFEGIQKLIDRSFNVFSRSEGKYFFDVTVYDNALNMTTYHGEVRIGENQPPTVVLNAPQIAQKGDRITLNAIASDQDGSIQKVIFYVDSSQIAVDMTEPYSCEWIAVSGKHTLRVEAYDDSGLMSFDEKVISVSVPDQTPPEITFMPQEKYPMNTSNRLFAIVKDDSGVDEVEFYANDTLISKGQKWPGSIYTCSWMANSTGTYILSVRAVDIFGNSNEVSATVKVITEEEYEMPQITQFLMNKTVLDLGEYLEVTVSAIDDDGLSLAELYIDSVKVDSETPQGNTFVLKWLASKLGKFNVKVVVYDKKGFSAEVDGQIRVETVRPIAQITSPDDDARRIFTRNLNITLSASVTDSSTPATYRFDVVGPEDTIPVIPEISGSKGHYIFDATWYPTKPGDYKIFFRYTDENNFAAEDVVNVKIVDTDIVITNPLNYSKVECGYPLNVEIEAGEDVTNVEIALKWAGNTIWQGHGVKSGNTFNATIPATAIKTLDWFTLVATSSTEMNEKSEDESVFETIDTTPPTFTLMVDDQKVKGGEIFDKKVYDVFDITVDSTDNHEIGSVEIFRNGISIFRSSSASFTTQETCQPFENDYTIKVQDFSGNSIQKQFTVIASETNKPELSAQATDSLSEIHVGDNLVVTISFNATDDILIDRFDVIFPDKTFSWNVDRSFVSTSVSISWTAPNTPGDYTIKLEVIDIFGNYSTFEHTISVSDTTSPMVEISAPSVISGTVDVEVRAFDNDTQTPAQSVTLVAKNPDGSTVNLGNPYYSKDGVFKFNFMSTAVMDGPVILMATAQPGDGYDELTVIVDNMKPTVESISLPFAPEYGYPEPVPVFSGPFSVSAQVGAVPVPYDVKWVKFLFNDVEVQRLDGTLYQYQNNKYTYTSSLIDPGDLEDGYASITVVVSDRANNLATLTTKAIFDTHPPSIEEIKNATIVGNKIYTNMDNITLRASDLTLDITIPSPKLYFKLGSLAYIIEANDDPKRLPSGMVEYGSYGYSSIPSNNLYDLELDLVDIANNSTTLTYEFYYDTLSPTINLIKPIPGALIGPDGTSIIAELYDNLSGVKKALVNAEYGTLQQSIWYDPASTISTAWNVPPDLEVDDVQLSIIATDNCQNAAATTVNMSIDTLAPRMNLISSDISTSTVSATQVDLTATLVLNLQDKHIDFSTLDATLILETSSISLSGYSTSGIVPDYTATLIFSDTVSSTDAAGSIDSVVKIEDTLGNQALEGFNLQ